MIAFLNACGQSLPVLGLNPVHVDPAVLRRQRKAIRSLDGEALRAQRNKWLAHHDGQAFDDPAAFVARHPVRLENMEQAIPVLEDVLEVHYLALGSDMTFEMPGEVEAERLLALLTRHREVEYLWGTNRIDDAEALRRLFLYWRDEPTPYRDF